MINAHIILYYLINFDFNQLYISFILLKFSQQAYLEVLIRRKNFMSKQKSVQFKKSALIGCQIIFQYFETFYRAYHHIEPFYCDDTPCQF